MSNQSAEDRVHLFFEFTRVINRLSMRYGTLEVAEQCKAWAELIGRVQAGIELHAMNAQSDGNRERP